MDEKKRINIAKFLDHTGKVIQIPAKAKTLLPVLQYVVSAFETERTYTEKEVNGLLREACVVDHMTMRRFLIDKGYLLRTPNGSAYWRGEGIPSDWRLPDAEKDG